MHLLLMSVGGGGGSILRSVMATFRRDLAVTRKTDSRYAERLRRAVTTRFLDTNEFALSDVPEEERFLIGARTTGRLGARHDPEVGLNALQESGTEVEELFSHYSIIILIGTGGKGTGSGTMFPLAQMARDQNKLVIPIFVRPSFERHEVDKRHYDHAVRAIEQFDAAGIRLIEIQNDRGYTEHDPQPQPIVWERMNVPFARGLRGLIYVLWDLSQVDPSDLSILFAGQGRLRIGFGEIDPPDGGKPTDEMVEREPRGCTDQRAPCHCDGRRCQQSLQSAVRPSGGHPETVGRDGVVCRAHGSSSAARSRLEPRERRTDDGQYSSNRGRTDRSCECPTGECETAGADPATDEPSRTEGCRSAPGACLFHVLRIRGCPQPVRSGGTGAGGQLRHVDYPPRRSGVETVARHDVVSQRVPPAAPRVARE